MCPISFRYRIPVLMSKLGTMGRILCGLFFICLSSGGLSSMISFLELTVGVIQNFGGTHDSLCHRRPRHHHHHHHLNHLYHHLVLMILVSRFPATIGALILSFLVGVPSALNIDILSNQVGIHFISADYQTLFDWWVSWIPATGFCVGLRSDCFRTLLLHSRHQLQPISFPQVHC